MGRRTAKENAVAKLCCLGSGVGLDGLPKRSSPEDVSSLYKALCKKLLLIIDMVEELLEVPPSEALSSLRLT